MDEVYSTLLRAILKYGAGALVTHGILSGSDAEQASGAITVLVSLIWGIASARKAKQARSNTTPPAA